MVGGGGRRAVSRAIGCDSTRLDGDSTATRVRQRQQLGGGQRSQGAHVCSGWGSGCYGLMASRRGEEGRGRARERARRRQGRLGCLGD